MSRHLNTLGWVGVLVITATLVTTTLASDGDGDDKPTKDLASAVVNLQLRVDHLENKLKDAQAERKKLDETLDEVKKNAGDLTKRVERLDRNTVAQIKRDLGDLEDDVDDLKTRVRRLE